MKSEVTNERPYKVPFNIMICDISNDSHNNTSLMKFLLGENYLNLSIKNLYSNEKSYIHKEWKWLFTQVNYDQILIKLDYYKSQNQPEMKNTMLLFKTESIGNEKRVRELLEQIEKLNPNNQPMTVIITNNQKETINTLLSIIGNKIIDKSSFYVINHINNNDKLLKIIYGKFYSICSYYNQLGDQYLFSKDIDDVDQGQVFIQRINIIVAGRPGCGKSTFINTILGDKRCLVGGGMSVTSKIVQYHHSRYPLSLYDTPGFENSDNIDNVIKTINSLNTEFKNKVKQIHLFLYLINSQDRTLLKLDQEFLTKFQQWREQNNQTQIPLLFILTKTNSIQDSTDKKDLLAYNLKNDFPFPHYQGIFPIELSDIYHTNISFGMKELMEWLHKHFVQYEFNNETLGLYLDARTEKEIYALNKQIYFLSQFTNKKMIIKSCLYSALAIVAGFTVIAGAEGFIPLPFLDMYALLPTQIAMITSVSLVYGIQREINEIKQWLGSFVCNGILAYGGKFLANALKCVPILGTISGCIIDGGVSAIATGCIGASAITFCELNFDENALKQWCINVIENYNYAIESFNIFREYFEQIEINNNKNTYEDD